MTVDPHERLHMQYPLEGVRILDFSHVVAGPYATRLLADLGADVVKVEQPRPDATRQHGPGADGMTAYFQQQNAGKRNICIDLQAPGAVEVALALAAQADVVVENYRPGVMGRLGLAYEDLRDVRPDVIMLSISGFGQTGPESHRSSYAPAIHAEAGLAHRLAERNQVPPGDLPSSVADTNTSLHGTIAVLAALRLRDLTGIGQHIDMAMVDATVATDDRVPFGLEGVADPIPFCPILDLPFGSFLMATDWKLMFRRLHQRAGMPDPAGPDTPLPEKIALREQAILDRFAACGDTETFAALMEVLDIPWGEVRDPRRLGDQPTLLHRGTVVQVDDRAGGLQPVMQSPYRFSNARSGVRGPAALQGEHNAQVLEDWLGWPTDRIEALVEAGALKRPGSEDPDPAQG